jgi:membrane-associated protein
MEIITQIIDFFLHLDKHLAEIIKEYGTTTYLILFMIVFMETGLVFMPLLPGDSLLFATGALAAATGALNVWLVIVLLIIAALLIKSRERILFFKREYLEKTEEFYAKHGGRTVIMARFIPIVRTVAPFVAGAGSMKYPTYIMFCIIGAFLWVPSLTLLGYFFGNMDFVKNNFEIVVFGIIGLSVLPMVWEYVKVKFLKPKTV